MTEFVTCLQCQTQNRRGAKFCSKCGQTLDEEQTLKLNDPDSPTAPAKPSSKTDTQPIKRSSAFEQRAPNAIFGDRFRSDRLIYSDEKQFGYAVTELASDVGVRQCSNAECGAIHIPRGEDSEKFCTRCSAPLLSSPLTLTLWESTESLFGQSSMIASHHLAHEAICAPITAFDEKVVRQTRYCLVKPPIEDIQSHSMERNQILNWGKNLAHAVDYLAENGLSFNGQINASTFGIACGKVVFANFSDCRNVSVDISSAREADVAALSTQLYLWLTGQEQFVPDPSLAPAVDELFKQALNPPGFSTGQALADAIDNALNTAVPDQAVQHLLGQNTNEGVVRTLNEDSLFTIQFNKYIESVLQPVGIYVVADGMGGHSAGEVASGTVVNTIAQASIDHLAGKIPNDADEQQKWIQETIQMANKTVFDLSKKLGSDMGTTVVMAVLDGNVAHIGHVGDSRAYRINSQGITPLTTDHSLVERLVATNQITPEEAYNHPQRNVIYRTIGDKPNVEVDTAIHELVPGDRLLLCSDGLNGMVNDDVIQQIVMKPQITPQQACDGLIAAANAAGGDDNISVVLVELVQV